MIDDLVKEYIAALRAEEDAMMNDPYANRGLVTDPAQVAAGEKFAAGVNTRRSRIKELEGQIPADRLEAVKAMGRRSVGGRTETRMVNPDDESEGMQAALATQLGMPGGVVINIFPQGGFGGPRRGDSKGGSSVMGGSLKNYVPPSVPSGYIPKPGEPGYEQWVRDHQTPDPNLPR